MMTQITQAFIFAAGRGERMKPVTDSIPKPLVKIKGKAIIDYAIEKLDQIPSIKKIIINGFYLADQIEDHIRKLNNPKITFSRELEKIETGGGLVFAKNLIDLNKPLLTVNGDIMWFDDSASDIDLMFKNWDVSEEDILLGLKKTEDYFGYDGNVHGGGDFNLAEGHLFRFPNEAMSHAYVGLQIINPKILSFAPSKCFSVSYFYKTAITDGGIVHRIKGVELQGKYFHIGNISAIKNTENELGKLIF